MEIKEEIINGNYLFDSENRFETRKMSLVIKPTEACNFACDFCSSSYLVDDKKARLDLEKIYQFLKRFPLTEVIFVVGGDPLLMPPSYYESLLNHIELNKYPTKLAITTNLWDWYKNPKKWENWYDAFGFSIDTSSNLLKKDGKLWRIDSKSQSLILAKTAINAAGLHACDVARSIEGIRESVIPKPYYAIGHYFTMSGKSPFSHLIYPVAGHGYLGVHVTLDMGGQVRFGPDIEWIDSVDYAFDDSRRQRFIDAVARYYPAVLNKEVNPSYTGIRPKISGPQDPSADFLIQTEADHGVPGLINLLGMESPGLTSCLSIADFVAKLQH
jgi:hypothetical protein